MRMVKRETEIERRTFRKVADHLCFRARVYAEGELHHRDLIHAPICRMSYERQSERWGALTKKMTAVIHKRWLRIHIRHA